MKIFWLFLFLSLFLWIEFHETKEKSRHQEGGLAGCNDWLLPLILALMAAAVTKTAQATIKGRQFKIRRGENYFFCLWAVAAIIKL